MFACSKGWKKRNRFANAMPVLVESGGDNPDDDMKKGFDPEDVFVIRSYISSEGDCLHENDGSVLEYTQINANLLYSEYKTRNFIRLFKPKN